MYSANINAWFYIRGKGINRKKALYDLLAGLRQVGYESTNKAAKNDSFGTVFFNELPVPRLF